MFFFFSVPLFFFFFFFDLRWVDHDSPAAEEYRKKCVELLNTFATNGDTVVKSYLAKPAVLVQILNVMSSLPNDILLLVLKVGQPFSWERTVGLS